MGFEQYAIEILKENRRVRNISRAKSPYSHPYTRTKKRSVTQVAENEQLIKTAEEVKNSRTWIYLVLFLVIAAGSYHLVFDYVTKSTTAYKKNLYETNQYTIEERAKQYFKYVKAADLNYNLSNYDAALADYESALFFHTKGRRAHIGLTKCWIRRCKKNPKDCHAADMLFAKLDAAKTLSGKEYRYLKSLYFTP